MTHVRTGQRTSGGRVCLCAMLALSIAGLRAEVDPLPTWQWVTDIAVSDARAAGNVLYLGGAFQYIGAATTEGETFVDVTTGALSSGCATRTGPQAGVGPPVVADPDGGLFMQTPEAPDQLVDDDGVFDVTPSRSFVRVGTDCRFDRSFVLGDFVAGDFVTRGDTILRVGQRIYVGGARSDGLGTGIGRLVAFSAATGARVSEAEYPQYATVLLEGVAPNGALIVSVRLRGDTTGTQPVGALNVTTGVFSQLAPGTSAGFVKVIGTTLYVSAAAGSPLTAIDLASGQPQVGWTGPAVAVNDLEVLDDRLFVAGSGLGRVGVFALSRTTGALIAGFNPVLGAASGAALSVERLAIVGARVFVRGRTIRSADGQERYQLAAVDAATGAYDPWAPMIFATSTPQVDLVPNGARLFVGRVLSNALVRRRYLAAVDTVTGDVLPFDPSTGGAAPAMPPVTALAANDQYLFVGTAQSQIRRVNLATGQRDVWGAVTSAAGQTPGRVAALAATSTTLYAGGFFDSAVTSGDSTVAPRAHGLAIDVATATLTPWNPAVVSPATGPIINRHPIEALVLVADSVVVGGNFSSAGGQPRVGLAALDSATGAALATDLSLPAGHIALGLTTDAATGTLFFIGVAESPIIGAADLASAAISLWTIPASEPTDVPTSRVSYLDGLVYSDREWDPEAAEPTDATSTWTSTVATDDGLVELEDRSDGIGGPVLLRFHAAGEVTTATAPRNLEVRHGGHHVFLSWDAPAAGQVQSYVVRAGSSRGQSNLADVDTGSTATSFAATAPEGVYYVRVHARNELGLSPPSNERAFALAANGCNSPPGAPGPLQGSGTDSVAALAWGPALGAVSYRVEAGSGTGLANLASIGVAGTSLVTLAPPGTYFVRVRGSNACGRGPSSNEIVVQVGGPPPGPPGDLQFSVTGSTVTLTWSAPSAGTTLDYRLEAGNAPGLSNLATATSAAPVLVVDGVQPGAYYVRVRARNAAGYSVPSAEVFILVQ